MLVTGVKGEPAKALPDTFAQICNEMFPCCYGSSQLDCFSPASYCSKAAGELGIPQQPLFCRQKYGVLWTSWEAVSNLLPACCLGITSFKTEESGLFLLVCLFCFSDVKSVD